MKNKNDGTPSINSNAKRFLLQRTRKRLDEIGQKLSDVSDDVKTALGEDSDLFSWVESLRGDTLDTIDIVDHAIANPSAVNEGSDLSDGESGWFNDLGELTPPDWAIDEFGIDPDKSPLPDECVRACSHSGRVDDDVSAWVDELKFDQNFPVERARRWLKGYGAWDEEELE